MKCIKNIPNTHRLYNTIILELDNVTIIYSHVGNYNACLAPTIRLVRREPKKLSSNISRVHTSWTMAYKTTKQVDKE